MQYYEQLELTRKGFFCGWYFDPVAPAIRLIVYRIAELKNGDNWEQWGGADAKQIDTLLSNDIKVNPSTFQIDETGTPAFDYVCGLKGSDLLTSMDSLIYPAIAGKIEQFVLANNLYQ